MKAAKEYLEAFKDEIETHQVHLTRHQIEAIKTLEKIYDQPFEDVVLLLVNHALSEIQEIYIKKKIREQSIRN